MKFQFLTSLLAATATVATGALVAPASAFDFVPQQEGEVYVGLECYDGCIELDPIFESIVSLTDASTGYTSRLFVDNFTTTNNYGNGAVKFGLKDAGTTHDGFWFRPSEYNANGTAEETGQLEVGTFQFNFSSVISELTIDFFDTESNPTTGAIAINGIAIEDWLTKGGNSNIQSKTYYDVSSITLKLGNDTVSGTGDGVNFRMGGEPTEAVPEPASIVAGLLASAGFAAARKRAKG